MISGILNAIYQKGIVSILRGIKEEYLEDTLDALLLGGINCVEITMNTKGSLRMIEKTKVLYGDRMVVGAGTVLNEVVARSAIEAGADFALSPILSIPMIEMCNQYNKLAVPGVFTPTEAHMAMRAGAQLIKVFPATMLGPQYIKDLLAPLDHLNLLPVGGVSEKNARAFIEAGSFALGVGSCLVNKDDTETGKFEEISTRARVLVSAVGR